MMGAGWDTSPVLNVLCLIDRLGEILLHDGCWLRYITCVKCLVFDRQARGNPSPWWVTESSRAWSPDSAASCSRESPETRTRASPSRWRFPTWRSTTRKSETCWIPKGERIHDLNALHRHRSCFLAIVSYINSELLICDPGPQKQS